MKIWGRLRAGWRRLAGKETAVSARRLLVAAEAARDSGRWKEAAGLYQAHAALRPRRVGSRIQLGNMRKQAGDIEGAARAYQEALAIRPTIEAWVQLGYLRLTSGQEGQAIEAFEAALALTKDCVPARQGMVAAGARHRLPAGTVDAQSLERLRRLTDQIVGAIEVLTDAAVWPVAFYDGRRTRVPPPPRMSDGPVRVLIDARGVSPARLRATLLGLLEQDHVHWSAVVVADPMMMTHPVASLAFSEPRIRFEERPSTVAADDAVITLDAGAVPDRYAIAWLLFAAERTSAQAVYADHDHMLDTESGRRRLDPVFHPAPDLDEMATSPSPPPLVLWRGDAATEIWRALLQDKAWLRSTLLRVIAAGAAAHLPVVLSGVLKLSPVAREGLPSPDETAPGYLEPAVHSVAAMIGSDGGEPIHVIIPTRDEVGLLAACVDGLYAHAVRPDRLHLTVVNNRSREFATQSWLARGAADGRFSVLAVDEPFNWSRLNNLAVAASDELFLLFLNNDTEMLTEGWDLRLASDLGRPEIGVVGARLLYPDLTVQHAGVVLGLGTGGPRHEGVGVPRHVGGPQGRWRRSRSVSAVTGAFMGVRRDVYTSIGGFDEVRLAIGYNDIDFCLRCREKGLRILYDANIELIHHESRTRGLNDTRGRIAWDVGELGAMQARWGATLARDPGVNPHWATVSSRPFDGVRDVSVEEAVAWLEASIGNPWRA